MRCLNPPESVRIVGRARAAHRSESARRDAGSRQAQLARVTLCKQEVTGSIPVGSTDQTACNVATFLICGIGQNWPGTKQGLSTSRFPSPHRYRFRVHRHLQMDRQGSQAPSALAASRRSGARESARLKIACSSPGNRHISRPSRAFSDGLERSRTGSPVLGGSTGGSMKDPSILPTSSQSAGRVHSPGGSRPRRRGLCCCSSSRAGAGQLAVLTLALSG
jgi:hypothetical protein